MEWLSGDSDHEDFLSDELNLNQISHLFKQKRVLFNSLERLCFFGPTNDTRTVNLCIVDIW